MISLYTTYYNERNPLRKEELDFCIYQNASNLFIDRIFLLNECNEEFFNPKIISVNIYKRPTYNNFLDLINLKTSENDFNIIANTDIYFDDTLKNISYILDYDKCIALNRWNIRNKKIKFEIGFGQDSWIFKGKIKDKIEALFFNGIPGADNRFAFELKKAGYNVINPSLSIKSFHMHNSGIRNYLSEDLIPSPYYYPLPVILRHKNEKVKLDQILLWAKIRIIYLNDFYVPILNRNKYRIFRKRMIDFIKRRFPVIIPFVKRLKNA